MITKLYPREKLTVRTMGYKGFWSGISLGLGYAIILYLLITFFRDINPWLRAKGYTAACTAYRIHPYTRYIHNILIAFLAGIMGEHICLSIWVRGIWRHGKNRLFHRQYQRITGYLLLNVGGVLLILVSLFCPYFLFHMNTIPDRYYRMLWGEWLTYLPPRYYITLFMDHLDYWILLIIFAFFFQFMIMRNFFQCVNWMILFAAATILFGLIFANVNVIKFY